MKILHLSDFHIVSDQTLHHANILKQKLEDIGIAFPLSVSEAVDRTRLLEHLKNSERSAYDAIVFSGDATSLGDTSSMQEAKDFLARVQEICLKTNEKHNCVAIPGNHDVLAYGMRALLGQLEAEIGLVGNFLLPFIGGGNIAKLKTALQEYLEAVAAPEFDPNATAGFRDIFRSEFTRVFDPYSCFPIGDDVICRSIDGLCPNGDPLRLNIFPVNTVPTHPHFVNMGMVTDEHLGNIRNSEPIIQNSPDGRRLVNLAVSHHGMMALSSETVADTGDGKVNLVTFLEHAISSQINGFKLGKALQSAGYDVHIHGHEHQNTVIRYDFDVENYGSIYSSGVAAAYGSDAHPISFASIELPSPFCMSVSTFAYSRSSSSFSPNRSDIVFDRYKATKSTELAKKEVSAFFFSSDGVEPYPEVNKEKFGTASDELLINSKQGILIFGVNLESMRDKMLKTTRAPALREKGDLLKKRILDYGIHILVVMPKHGERTYEIYDEKDVTDDLEKLRGQWDDFFKELARNTSIDTPKLKSRFDIRYTNTPLSHAGTCEFIINGGSELEQPKFSRALIQTIKIVRAYDTNVFMELDYRTDTGLLGYFAGSAWNLWDMAERDQLLFDPEVGVA